MAGTVNGFYQPDTTYTPPTGYTNQAQQLQNTQSVLQNNVPGGIPSQPQLQQQLTTQSTNLSNMETPQARADYLNRSQMPMMQDNFDDLARQLYAYDQQHLAPIYTQKPPTPADAVSYGRVPTSDLMQLTPGSVLGANTLYADNPKYAAASTAAHQQGIIAVLNALNDAISGEFNQTKRKYGSTVQSQKDILSSITDLMGLRNQMDIAKLNAATKSKTAAEKQADIDAQVLADIRNGITLRDLSKKYADVEGTHLLDLYNRASPYGPASEDPEQMRKFGLNVDTGLSAAEKTKVDLYRGALTQLDRFESQYAGFDKTGPVAGRETLALQNLAPWAVDQNLVTYNSSASTLRDVVLNALSGTQVSGPEQQRVLGWIPSVTKSPQKNASDLIALRNWLQDNYKATSKSSWPGATTPADPAAALRDAGYSEEQIQEYLKLKGL